MSKNETNLYFHFPALTDQYKSSTKAEIPSYKTGVINDPLGQTHSHANIVFCCLDFLDLKRGDGWTDGQHVRKQLSLPAVDCGLAEWIKNPLKAAAE